MNKILKNSLMFLVEAKIRSISTKQSKRDKRGFQGWLLANQRRVKGIIKI